MKDIGRMLKDHINRMESKVMWNAFGSGLDDCRDDAASKSYRLFFFELLLQKNTELNVFIF